MKNIIFILLWALPAFSQTLEVTWNPSEGADGYKFYWGMESRNYTDLRTTPNTQIQIPLSWFKREKTYFFAVTATAFNFYESEFSNEVSFFLTTGIEENIINFKECAKVKVFNIRGQKLGEYNSMEEINWSVFSSGTYIQGCFDDDNNLLWAKKQGLLK